MTDSSAVSTTETQLDDEWDDTPTSLQLRAIFTFVAGALLLWSQVRAPIDAHTQWSRFIWTSAWSNFILPLGIIWLFFAQTVRHQSYLRNQALNAWNYGWNFRGWKTDCKLALIMTGAMLPVLWFASRTSSTRSFYAGYYPSPETVGFGVLLLSIVAWMLFWEFFFRGFLLFGFAQAFPERVAPFVAIPLQAAMFGAAHIGKPPSEMYASFIGGIVLGVVAWRQKSWLAPFLTHAIVQMIWAFLMLRT